MHTSRRVTLVLCLALACSATQANSGIPGPLIWSAGSLTVNPLQWVAACMVMCIAVEGFFYKHWQLFARPYATSAYLNTASLIAGIPLALLGLIDPTWFVLPTLASTLVEAALAARLPTFLKRGRSEVPPSTRRWLKVFAANLVSNLIMAGYLYLAYRRAT